MNPQMKEGHMTALGGWSTRQWAELGVRSDGEPMSAEEMASCDPYPDCICGADTEVRPEDHDGDCPENPNNYGIEGI
jgi:hypothetical protein